MIWLVFIIFIFIWTFISTLILPEFYPDKKDIHTTDNHPLNLYSNSHLVHKGNEYLKIDHTIRIKTEDYLHCNDLIIKVWSN